MFGFVFFTIQVPKTLDLSKPVQLKCNAGLGDQISQKSAAGETRMDLGEPNHQLVKTAVVTLYLGTAADLTQSFISYSLGNHPAPALHH